MVTPSNERRSDQTADDRPRGVASRAFAWAEDWWAGLLRGQVPTPMWVDSLTIAAVLALSWWSTYMLGGAGSVAPHWFYVGILLAAARFGYAGATIAAVTSGILAGPLMPLDVGDDTTQAASDWVSRAGFFLGIGTVMAWIIRRLQRALRRELAVRDQERELAERSAAMIQSVSHEFRTPMTILNNGLELLRSADLDESQRSQINEALTNALRRLNDLTELVVTADEAVDGAPSSEGSIDIHALCRETADRLGKDGAEKRVVVPNAQLHVAANGRLLEIVVRCILDNALKFSPPDTPVRVETTRHETSVEIAIHDQGPGIDPAVARRSLEAPFDPERDTAPTGGGLGLGLFTANQAGKRLGATLELRPHSRGTTAIIDLPAPRTPAGPRQELRPTTQGRGTARPPRA